MVFFDIMIFIFQEYLSFFLTKLSHKRKRNFKINDKINWNSIKRSALHKLLTLKKFKS